MAQHDGNFKDILKSQISFLKSFDQKLEGLTREKDRLKKIVESPKLRFSRSSLGGLHRIVNGLKSAGPVFGFSDIEEWAKRTDGWLSNMEKLADKPSEDDVRWLMEAIEELAGLRDSALCQAEGKEAAPAMKRNEDTAKENADAKNENPAGDRIAEDTRKEDKDTSEDDVAPDNESDEADETKPDEGTSAPFAKPSGDTPDSPFDDTPDSPFDDVPKKNSLAETQFADDTGRESDARDNTSTIPLGVEDLSEMIEEEGGRRKRTTIPLTLDDLEDMAGPGKPPPVKRAAGRASSPTAGAGPWRPLAIVAILGCMVMTALYLKEREAVRLLEEAAAEAPPPPSPIRVAAAPAPPKAPPVSSPEKGARDTAANEPVGKVAAKEASAEVKTAEKGGAEKESKKKAPSSAEKRKRKDGEDSSSSRKEKQERAKKRIEEKSKTETASKPKTGVSEDKDTGTLIVKAADGASVTVLVDGVSKGRAPIRVKLKPGIHELTFIANGKRSMQVVPIRAGKTKTVEAKAP